MGDYLLVAWGGGWEEAKRRFPPDLERERSLHWWFATRADREFFAERLNHCGIVSGLVCDRRDPVDEDGNETDTHKRTVAKVVFRLQDGSLRSYEHDFGYGYPASAARYMFEDGNYACDCNRSLFLGLEPEMECGDTIKMEEFDIEERE